MEAVTAFGIGVSCYLGRKALNSTHKWAPEAGKSVLAISGLAMLHFSGVIGKNSPLNEWVGIGVPIPGLDGLRVNLNIKTMKSLSYRIYQVAQENFNHFYKRWVS